jgi:hypothetical protein
MIRAWARVAKVALCYTLLAAWLTWPLAGSLATHLPRNFPGWDFDQNYSGWVLAWESRALVDGNAHLADANIYHPESGTLFYGPLALGALPLFAPLFLSTGNPTLALNFVFLAGIALSATLLHLVVRAWSGSHAAGAVAAVAFLANRWLLLILVPSVPHLAVLFYFPLIVFLAATSALRWRAALLLLVLVVLQCLTDPVYVAPAVLAPLLILAVYRGARAATRGRGVRLAAIVAVATSIVGAVFLPYLSLRAENPNLAQQTNWPRPKLEALDLPGGLFSPLSPLAIPSLALLLIVVAVAVAAWRGWRGSRAEASAFRHALLWSGLGILLSLPLNVRLGDTLYPVPFVRLARDWVPLFASIRSPERLRVAALFGLTLLAGLAFAELARHIDLTRGRGRAARLARAAVATLVVVALYTQYEYALAQPQAYGPRLSAGYKIGAAVSDDSAVLGVLRASGGPTLELPLPRRQPTMAGPQAEAMYRSIFHRQPLLNGYSSFWPRRFPERMRLAAELPAAAALQALRRQTGVLFVLVRLGDDRHEDRLLADQRTRFVELAARGGGEGLKLLVADDDLLLFRVVDPPR